MTNRNFQHQTCTCSCIKCEDRSLEPNKPHEIPWPVVIYILVVILISYIIVKIST